MTAELDLAATTGGVLATPAAVDELGRLTAAWLLSFRSANVTAERGPVRSASSGAK